MRLLWTLPVIGGYLVDLRVLLHEIFYRTRLWIAATFLPEKHARIFRDLRKNGYHVLRGYFGPDEMQTLHDVFKTKLDDLAAAGDTEYHRDPHGVIREPGNLRIHHFNKHNGVIRRFSQDAYFVGVNFLFSGRIVMPTAMIGLTHDGSYKHPAAPGKVDNEKLYGGIWHFDQWFHQMKVLAYMTPVTEENGATEIVPNTGAWTPLFRETYHAQFLANRVGKTYMRETLGKTANKADLYDQARIDQCIEKAEPISAYGEAGDVVLFDTRFLHRAGRLKRGQRQILWYYF